MNRVERIIERKVKHTHKVLQTRHLPEAAARPSLYAAVALLPRSLLMPTMISLSLSSLLHRLPAATPASLWRQIPMPPIQFGESAARHQLANGVSRHHRRLVCTAGITPPLPSPPSSSCRRLPPVRSQPSHQSTVESFDLRESILNQTDFSLSLAKHVISAHAKDTNLVFSPLLIHGVLGLIAAGSGGPTRDQLLGLLKSKSIEELNLLSSQMVTDVLADGRPLGGPRLSFANGVWVDCSLRLNSDFEEIVDKCYRAASNHVDFQKEAVQVTKQVNEWIEKVTNGLIKEILPSGSVDALTRLILANAVYFKGAWKVKFNASETKYHDFFLINGSSVEAPFMTSKRKQYIRAFKDFKVLQLPYKRGEDKRQFSMYIFLPNAKYGLPSLIEKVSSGSGFIEQHLPYEKVKVGDFRIPKFKISFGFEASKTLKGLGLALPFSAGGLAEMVDSPTGKDLYVSNIFHKSYIKVNEEGTEAAAATGAVIKLVSYRHEEEIDFVADHPFLFVIREDTTGMVLFVGQLLNPRAERGKCNHGNRES